MPMSNDEVGHLVARLSLNVEEFMAANKKVQDDIHKTHTMLEKLGEKSLHFGKELGTDVANRLLGGLGFGGIAGGLASGLVHTVEKTVEVMEKYEKSEIKLTAVLEVNRRNVAETSREYENYTEHLRAASDMNYLQIKGLLVMAETYGLTGEAAERATHDAAALAEMTGRSAESMLRLRAMIEEGDIEGAMRFKRMVPQLRNVNTEMEMLVKLQALQDSGGKSMERNANSFGAIWHRTVDRMEKGLGIVGDYVAKNSPGLGMFLKAFGLIAEKSEQVPGLSVKEEMALGGFKMIEKRIEKLREEAKYAHLASQAEKDRAKAIDMGILSQPGGRALLDAHKMYADYLEGTKAWLEALKGVANEYDAITGKLLKMNMHDAEKAAYDRQQKLERFKEEHPQEKQRAAEIERHNKKLDHLDRLYDSQRMLKEQETPQIKFAREQEYILKLAKEFHWTQEQINEALEIQRNKIFGVMAAAQAADSAFSAANAHRQFVDYFNPNRGKNVLSPAGGYWRTDAPYDPAATDVPRRSGGAGDGAVGAASYGKTDLGAAIGSMVAAVDRLGDRLTDPANGINFVFVDSGD